MGDCQGESRSLAQRRSLFRFWTKLVHILAQKEALKQRTIQRFIVLKNRYQIFFGAHWCTHLLCSKYLAQSSTQRFTLGGLIPHACLTFQSGPFTPSNEPTVGEVLSQMTRKRTLILNPLFNMKTALFESQDRIFDFRFFLFQECDKCCRLVCFGWKFANPNALPV